MCIGMCIDVFIDMCIGACIDMCVGVCIDMRIDLSIHMSYTQAQLGCGNGDGDVSELPKMLEAWATGHWPYGPNVAEGLAALINVAIAQGSCRCCYRPKLKRGRTARNAITI